MRGELAKEPDPVARIKRCIWLHLELLDENQALDELSLHWVLTNKGKSYIKGSAEQLCRIFLRGIVKREIEV